jgi:hypothetical protein
MNPRSHVSKRWTSAMSHASRPQIRQDATPPSLRIDRKALSRKAAATPKLRHKRRFTGER